LLGAVLLATLYVPLLTVAEEPSTRWVPAVSCTIGIALVWLFCCIADELSFGQWLQCDLVLLAYLAALGGLTSSLAAWRVTPALSAALITVIALAWLTWPVWLSPWLTQGLVTWLVPAHPIMALNSVVKHLGTWDRAPIAYRQLTTLNEDVSYRLPRTIIPMLAVHVALGAAGWVSSWKWSRRGANSPSRVP